MFTRSRLFTSASIVFAWLSLGAKECTINLPWDDGDSTPAPTMTIAPCDMLGLGGSGAGGADGVGGSYPPDTTAGAAASTGAGSGAGGGDPGDPSPQGLTCGGGLDASLLQGYLVDADPAGGVSCSTPVDCSSKCFAASKYCVEHAVHPYKPPMVGDLYQCIDSLPPASLGGSYTCLYQYPNGDACIFARAAKLGPITLPAPPPLCVYKAP